MAEVNQQQCPRNELLEKKTRKWSVCTPAGKTQGSRSTTCTSRPCRVAELLLHGGQPVFLAGDDLGVRLQEQGQVTLCWANRKGREVIGPDRQT